MVEAVRLYLHSADAWLRHYPVLRALAVSIAIALLVFSVLGVIFAFIERRNRRDLSRYGSPNFRNDIVYTLVYQGGIYNVLVYAPLFALAAPHLTFLQINLLKALPPIPSILVYWTTVDLIAYWLHRLQHRLPILWAFHSVHHTQTKMTYLTSNRNHLLEQFYVNVLLLAPALVIGMPATRWMPFYFAQTFFEHAQHAQLRWGYGPLHRLFVSPRFHAMHHSTEAAEYNGNYAKIFSLWDVLFGTFVKSDGEPAGYGVAGMDVPETLLAQFVHPFKVLGHSDELTRGRPLPTIAQPE